MDSSAENSLLRPEEQRALEVPLKQRARALQQLGGVARLAGWPLDSPQVVELAERIRNTPDKKSAQQLRRELKVARKALERLGIALPELTNKDNTVVEPEETPQAVDEAELTPAETPQPAAAVEPILQPVVDEPKGQVPTVSAVPKPAPRPVPSLSGVNDHLDPKPLPTLKHRRTTEQQTATGAPFPLHHMFEGILATEDIMAIHRLKDEERRQFVDEFALRLTSIWQKNLVIIRENDIPIAQERIRLALQGKSLQEIADLTGCAKTTIQQYFRTSVPKNFGRSPEKVCGAFQTAWELRRSTVSSEETNDEPSTTPQPASQTHTLEAVPLHERSIDEEPVHVQLAHRWHELFLSTSENEPQQNSVPSKEAFKSFFNPDKRCDMTQQKQQIVDRFRQLIIDPATEKYNVDIPDEHRSSFHRLLGFGINTQNRRVHYYRPLTFYAIAHEQRASGDTAERAQQAFSWLLEQQMPHSTNEVSPQTEREQWLVEARVIVNDFAETVGLDTEQATALWQRTSINNDRSGGHKEYTPATKAALDKVVAQIGSLNLFDNSSADRQPFLDFFLTFGKQPLDLDQLQTKHFSDQSPAAAERFIIDMIGTIKKRLVRGENS